MPMYHAEPNRSEPNRWMWFSVETPSVFKEHKLPASSADWSTADQRKFRELETLAENYSTHIHRSGYRRG
jgi:hypothetical protein